MSNEIIDDKENVNNINVKKEKKNQPPTTANPVEREK